MNSLVCVDSMICIWGVKKVHTKGQEAMVPLADNLIARLQKEKKQILLPAPVVTELLAPVDKVEDWAKLMSVFNSSFRVGVVDTLAASISAKIWQAERDHWKDVYEDGGDGIRNRFKFDLLILGVAIANRVDCLYTGDKRLCTLAAKHSVNVVNVLTQGVPRAGVQLSLEGH